MPDLEIKDLHVQVDGKTILNGIDLVVKSGEVHAIMGPNGSGKSTLALTIMGHPRYKVTSGSVRPRPFRWNELHRNPPGEVVIPARTGLSSMYR